MHKAELSERLAALVVVVPRLLAPSAPAAGLTRGANELDKRVGANSLDLLGLRDGLDRVGLTSIDTVEVWKVSQQ